MKNIVAMILLLLPIVAHAGQPASTKDPSNPGKTPATSTAGQKSPPEKMIKGQKPLDCVRSINQFGQPGNCKCGPGLSYNPITGRCVKGGLMCTQALVEMIQDKTGQCYTARNGCEASDLKSMGWRKRAENDRCTSSENP